MGIQIVERELLSSEAMDTEVANYTLTEADAEAHVLFTKATAGTVTIPPQSAVPLPIGTVIYVNQSGAGAVTITAGAGVTLHSRGGLVATNGQYAEVKLTKTADDTWNVSGDRA